ncbi:MAG: glycosyltransferase family 2 protein [Promethearchaeota archaeon]
MLEIKDDKTCILLLIPCYNEEANIENILYHLINVKKRVSSRTDCILDFLIINDGSTDRTKEILNARCNDPDFKIIHFSMNRGYGHVLKTGFKYAADSDYRWIISFDMDGQHEPKCLYKFLEQIMKGDNDAVIISGSRYLDSKLFWQNPWKDRFLVNTIITGILNTLGFSLTDGFCGMKAHLTEKISTLDLIHDGYEMPIEMLIKSRRAGFKIIELAVPVIYKCRDDIITKNTPDPLLFKKGEERIERYFDIISEFASKPLKNNVNVYQEMFTYYFNKTREINKQNYSIIQNEIFSTIKELEL